MPKPTKQQIRDAIDEELGNAAHLGVEFAVQSVMDQYDISGIDVALAYIKEPDVEEKEEDTDGFAGHVTGGDENGNTSESASSSDHSATADVAGQRRRPSGKKKSVDDIDDLIDPKISSKPAIT